MLQDMGCKRVRPSWTQDLLPCSPCCHFRGEGGLQKGLTEAGGICPIVRARTKAAGATHQAAEGAGSKGLVCPASVPDSEGAAGGSTSPSGISLNSYDTRTFGFELAGEGFLQHG